MTMADEEDSDSAHTVQMSADQIKRLHAELEGKRAAAAAKARQPIAQSEEEFVAEEAPEEEPLVDDPALFEPPEPEPEPPPAKAAKAVKPAKPAPAPKPAPAEAFEDSGASQASPGGGGLLIVGGIGAIFAGIGAGLPVLSSLQGMVGEPWPIIGGTIAMVLGHLLLGLGMFGAVSRSNGVPALVGTLHMLTVAGLAFFLLAAFRVIELDGDLIPYVMLAPGILPGTTWLLSGIWGLSAASSAGAMGILHGIFALLGGAAQLTVVVGLLAGAFGPQDDLTFGLQFGAPGAILLGAIFLAIAMFGRLRRPQA